MEKKNIKNLDLTLYYEKLDNGLEIYVIPKNSNIVYATFSTKYGSNKIDFVPIREKKMITSPLGIAHFLEHKLFEQPDGIDPFTFYSERGADANANTDQNKTTYLFSGAGFIEENLNYLLNYVQKPYFTDENVEKEKGIITQEIKMYQDDPNTVIYESILKNSFSKHPMKEPIIGTIDSIQSITKEDLYTCYNTFYHPSNMFIVVTGNVIPEDIISIIKKNQMKKKFDSCQDIKIKKYNEPEEVAKKEETKNLNISIPRCAIAYKIKIPKNQALYQFLLYILTLFDAKLGSTSNLVEALKEEELINDNLVTDFINTEEYILFTVLAETMKPDIVLEKIQKELQNLKIEEEEFLRKKKTLLSSLIYTSDNIFSINQIVMNDIIRYHNFNPNRYEEIKNLNYKEFCSLTKELNLNNFTTMSIYPKD